MKCIRTKKGGCLVIVNECYGCYTDNEGVFKRSVENIQKEVSWAIETWENKEIVNFPYEENLLKELQYVEAYKNSLISYVNYLKTL